MPGKRKKNKKNSQHKKRQFLQDDRFRLVMGFFTLFFSLFVTIAFVSYLFTWKADQTFEFQQVFSNSGIQVDNWAGKAGAYLALLFISEWVGLAAFALPFLLSIAGLRFFDIRL
ncbi:MAG: DNA translocase FtsK 4TM domain-containing protein, partial [Bacteroidota bacterium]